MKWLLHDNGVWVPAALLAAAMLGGWALAWRRASTAPRHPHETPASRFTDASIAILGLLLAFTFSDAQGKYDQRRLAVIADSNAIGDFGTCAALLPEAVREKLLAQIRAYVELRLTLGRERFSAAVFEGKLDEIQALQNRMQGLVKEAIDQGTPVGIPLVNSFNSLTSNHAARLAAARDRIPLSILGLLFLTATVTMVVAGTQEGAKKERNLAGTVGFITLVCLVIWVTLDLDLPQNGLISVSQEPLQRLLKGLGG
jgi:hypothetical protein